MAERFFRTPEEQTVYGRVYRNVAELRRAVGVFVELYNHEWRPEKNGFLSPSERRREWYAKRGQNAAR